MNDWEQVMSDSSEASVGLSESVLEHFYRPRHGGVAALDDVSSCRGCAGAVKSGTEVCFDLRIDSAGTITDLSWQVYGCPSTLAAASWLAERIKGGSVSAASSLTALDVERALQVAPRLRSRLLLVEDALRAALNSAGALTTANGSPADEQ